MTEPTYPCAKCGQLFPSSQIHQHFMTCQGRVLQPNQLPYPQNQFPMNPQQVQSFQSQFPQYHSNQFGSSYVPPTPQHQHIWTENDTYKVCLDPSCKQIKVKLRGSWQIFLRYGLKLFWIQMAGALALAFYIASVTGIHH